MHLGVPVIIDSSSELARVTTCLNEYPISREFAAEIKLQAIITDFTNVLSHTANDGAIDSSILHLLDRELEGLKSSYPDQWTRMLEYNTLIAKLHMYALVISRDRAGNTARDILLKLAFSTSLRVIYLASMRHNEDQSESHGQVAPRQHRAFPKSYFKGLAFTTAFLLRYFSLNPAASVEEQQLAANHVVLSHSIFTSCSLHPTDELGRFARRCEELCQHGPMVIDTQRSPPGDRVGVDLLVHSMRLASGLQTADATSCKESPVAPTAEPVPADPGLIPLDAFGMTDQLLDPWATDMVFSNQLWGDPGWDALSFPFADAQFPPRQNG
jgi:hypothetical protein